MARYVVETVEPSRSGLDWSGICTTDVDGTVGRGFGRSEPAAIRRAINNYIHVRDARAADSAAAEGMGV